MLQLADYKSEVNKTCVASGVNSRVPKWLKAVEDEAFSTRPLWFLVRKQTLTLVVDQEYYVLDERMDGRRAVKFSNSTADGHIHPMKLAELLWADATPTETGDPYAYVLEQMVRVQAFNTTACKVAMATSASGDESKVVVVKGYDSSNIYRTDPVTLDGTDSSTSVNSAITWAIGRIEEVTKQSTFTNSLTVTADAAATTIVTLAPNDKMIEAPKVRFRRIPSAADSVPYYFYMKARELTHDYDSPLIPEQFQWSVGMNGCFYHASIALKDFKQAAMYKGLMDAAIKKMITWAVETPGLRIKEPDIKPRGLRFDYDSLDAYGTP